MSIEMGTLYGKNHSEADDETAICSKTPLDHPCGRCSHSGADGHPGGVGVFQQPVMDEYGLSEQGAGYAFGILIAALAWDA